MTFERELWNEWFYHNDVPNFPCPRCGNGRMQPTKHGFSSAEPDWSVGYHSHSEFNPSDITKRFSLRVKCNNAMCGEIAHVSGISSVEVVRDDHGEWDEIERLFPEAFVPSPPIIALPQDTPNDVRDHIKNSFALFWMDSASCANRLRTSVEGVLDDFKIPKQGTSAKGKIFDLNAAQRIEEFKKINPEQGATLDALRLVGNVGSHEGEITKNSVLGAYQIYEDALAEIYGKRSATAAAIRTKLIEAHKRKK